MRTFVTSRPVAQSFTPYRVMSETVRRRMYGDVVPMDDYVRAMPSARSASLRAVPIFVVTALRAAAAIARGSK